MTARFEADYTLKTAVNPGDGRRDHRGRAVVGHLPRGAGRDREAPGPRCRACRPIHLHRNGWVYRARHPALGFDDAAWPALRRLAGADTFMSTGCARSSAKPTEP